MAGNDPTPTPKPEPDRKPAARVKNFLCKNCGAPVTIRYPGVSLSVVCDNCHSVIDATDENYRILNSAANRGTYKLLIPLGQRGKLRGTEWECVGFMSRMDVKSLYYWQEYLLFNPYYGYRFLVEDRGKWNFVRMIKRRPETENMDHIANLDGESYKIFNRGTARVIYVTGEFYWRVAVGEEVLAIDYVAPPLMLSLEKDNKEKVWSIGEYVTPQEVRTGFKLLNELPMPVGVAANEPCLGTAEWNKVKTLWIIFCLILTCGQCYFTTTSLNKNALTYTHDFPANTKAADLTTPVFVLDKDKADVQLTLHAPVKNSWFYVSGELVNNDTGESFPFERSIEYYYGTDSDGAWSEGSEYNSLMISSVPKGRYYINYDTESGEFKDLSDIVFGLIVSRDVPTYDNFLWTLFLITIWPVMSWLKIRQHEVSRWSNSDYNPYVSSSSD